MRKSIVFLMLICLMVIPGRAQNGFQRELSVGGSVGTSFSSVKFTPKVYQGMLNGFTVGGTARWITEKHLGLQVELNFAQQGWKEDFPDNPDDGYEYSRTGNYIELPFLSHIYFGSERARFFINMGPKIGYLLSESTSENLRGEQPNRVNEQHAMPIENKFDWGLCGGPGMEIRTGIGCFLLEGRYYYGLGNIYGSKKKDFFPNSSPQVISVKLTYLIPILKK